MGYISFLVEEWVEFAISVVVVLARISCRIWMVGVKGLRIDDYLMVLVVVLQAISNIAGAKVYNYGGTNQLLGHPPGFRETISDELRIKFEMGSKWFILGYNAYITSVWLLRVCMLCFFGRVLNGLDQQKYLLYGWLLTVPGFIVLLFTPLFLCQPYSKSWQVVPDPGCTYICTDSQKKLDQTRPVRIPFDIRKAILGMKTASPWIQCIFNCQAGYPAPFFVFMMALSILNTTYIILIPMPIMFRTNMELPRKIAVICLFGLGIFVIISSVTKTIMLETDPENWVSPVMWGVREVFIAILVGNIPMISPLISRYIRSWRARRPAALEKGIPRLEIRPGLSAFRRRQRRVVGRESDVLETGNRGYDSSMVPSTEEILTSNEHDIDVRRVRGALEIIEGREWSVTVTEGQLDMGELGDSTGNHTTTVEATGKKATGKKAAKSATRSAAMSAARSIVTKDSIRSKQ